MYKVIPKSVDSASIISENLTTLEFSLSISDFTIGIRMDCAFGADPAVSTSVQENRENQCKYFVSSLVQLYEEFYCK